MSAMQERAIEPTTSKSGRLHAVSVLVVDDDDSIRELYGHWLSAEGAEVTTVASVAEGKWMVSQATYDVVILDLDLPDGRGTDVARVIEPGASALIIVTAHASPGAGRAAVEAGAERVFAKPVERESLLRAVVEASHASSPSRTDAEIGSIQERVRHLERLLEITRDVATSRDLDTVLDTALDELTDWLDAEGGSILLRGEDDTLVFAHAVGPGGPALVGKTIGPGEGIAGWVLDHRRPLAVADVRRHPHFCPAPDAESGIETRSVLAAPLQIADRVIGVVEVVNKRLGAFVRADRLALESVGFALGAAIENARIHERLERSRRVILNHSRDLETRVRERTSELRAANESLENALERLREAKDQMVHAEKMASLGSIAAGIAHEINNPIGFVGSNLNTLTTYLPVVRRLLEGCRDGADREELMRTWADEDVDFILDDLSVLVAESQDGIQRVAKIVRDLRQFSRSDDAGTLEATDVDDCVQSALTLLRNELKYTVDVRTELGGVPVIQGYSGPLTQVIVNLVINAVHALDGAPGHLVVRTREAGAFLEIDVEDDGPGIPDDYVKRIFDPFFTTKEPGKGTGLGLAISYEIVQRHGGELVVSTQVGQGTCFTIRLPRDLGRGE